MARSFSQRELLDQIHFMDPEDLLKLEVEELPGLHDHATENLRVLTLLQEVSEFTLRSISTSIQYRDLIVNDVTPGVSGEP